MVTQDGLFTVIFIHFTPKLKLQNISSLQLGIPRNHGNWYCDQHKTFILFK